MEGGNQSLAAVVGDAPVVVLAKVPTKTSADTAEPGQPTEEVAP